MRFEPMPLLSVSGASRAPEGRRLGSDSEGRLFLPAPGSGLEIGEGGDEDGGEEGKGDGGGAAFKIGLPCNDKAGRDA
jgi:hypothetical protein